MYFTIDPDESIIQSICNSMVGEYIVIHANILGKTIPLSENESMNNVVGGILESILPYILKEKLPHFITGLKQSSPDFYNNTYEYELKCFEKRPKFDISNYHAYISQIEKENGLQRKLETKYLIFQYQIEKNGIQIRSFDYLNIWNLIGYDGKYPISLQNKNGIWYNIRPSSKKSWKNVKKTPQYFVEQLIKSIQICPNPIKNKDILLNNIQSQYKCIFRKENIAYPPTVSDIGVFKRPYR